MMQILNVLTFLQEGHGSGNGEERPTHVCLPIDRPERPEGQGHGEGNRPQRCDGGETCPEGTECVETPTRDERRILPEGERPTHVCLAPIPDRRVLRGEGGEAREREQCDLDSDCTIDGATCNPEGFCCVVDHEGEGNPNGGRPNGEGRPTACTSDADCENGTCKTLGGARRFLARGEGHGERPTAICVSDDRRKI